MAGQRIVLRLDGIMQKAVIYLDRQEIGVWEDGYLPLRLDITSRRVQGREHHLHVVFGGFDRVVLPNGMQKITGLLGYSMEGFAVDFGRMYIWKVIRHCRWRM